MKLGIIVIFNNNADQINVEAVTKSLKPLNDMVFCLVDNQSEDTTNEKLREIREGCFNVDIVEIKKQSSHKAAKRAGARFMFNSYNLKHIGFIDANSIVINNLDISKIIELVGKSKSSILDFNKEQKQIRQTLFKSIFSVLDFLKHKDSFNPNNNPSLSVI